AAAIPALKPLATIRIKNTSELERKDEVVEVNFSALSSKVQGKTFKVLEAESKKEAPYQLEYKGFEEPQNLLLQIRSLKPGQEIVFEIVPGEPVKAESKTFARYVPERKDDFAWENDRIAFRMYGKALEGTKENAFGTDIWSKRTDKLIIDKWYKKGSYHTDSGEGMDYYHVGFTLGAGNIAPYLQDSIYFSKNYRQYKVLDNGPLRSSFQLGYDSWKVGNMTITATKTISLSAGSQLNRVEINYLIQGANETDAVIGISKRKQPGAILLDEKNGVMGYWEPEMAGKGIMGVGVILANPAKEMSLAHEHLLSHTSIQNNKPFVYYNGGAWNRAGIINTADEWFKYLENYKYRLNTPLTKEVY
ncbi:MAG TPA: DUF4861 family protein, partial [Sphingobacteriaceae bacterium]